MLSLPDPGSDARAALRAELETLTTEVATDALRDLDTYPTAEIAAIMNEHDRDVPVAVAAALPRITAAIDDISASMRRGGRLIYVGAGTPGRLGILDASECPPTFNTDPSLVVGLIAGGDIAIRTAVEEVEDDPHAGEADMNSMDLGPNDSVVGISASGRTPYVVGALQYARSCGALTVAVACNSDSAIGKIADHAIEVIVGPEIIAGSTRLKAGTAQKLVLNMISTITMIRLGKTYGNIMVDLRATNSKLRARAERAVMRVTGRAPAESTRALDAAGGSVKLAILMIERGFDAQEASEKLAEAMDLRSALDASR
ncbi:N-acetylmuramic acid 6-phosphate etherase [Leifsonia sp. L25]|uniref:N-acetylmuramic acid 6-phosphate etherase n=1 Tax=Leifsonia sp. L25 TaxID=3423957 RepID=UPI003D68444B